MIKESNIVESPIVPSNSSHAGVQGKGKKFTLLGDDMISGIKRMEFNGKAKENAILKTFSGATIKDMLSYAEPTLDREKSDAIS